MSDGASRKGRGCFFYGCLGVIVAVLLAVVGIYFGARYAIKTLVATYTEGQPKELPKVEMTDAELQEINSRLAEFKTALEKGRGIPPLILSGKDLNMLISSHPDWKELKDKIYVRIEGDQIKGDVSEPLDKISSMIKGRYFNGSASFKVSLRRGILLATMQSAEVKGTPVPTNVLAQLQGQNLAQEFYKNAENAEMLGRLESIEVKDGLVIVTSATNGVPSQTVPAPLEKP